MRLLIAALLIVLPASSATAGETPSVIAAGVVNGDNHRPQAFKSGRFLVRVNGTAGLIRYSSRRQHVSFRSMRIRLLRDETVVDPTIVVSGRGVLNGARVRFYVRCIDAGGPLEDVFYVNFRELRGWWLQEAGGRIWSGNVVIARDAG
jgi:hypothetical protein